MSTLVLKDAKIYLDKFDISGACNSCKLTTSADMVENTTFGTFFHTSVPGLKKADAHIEGYSAFGTGVTAIDGQLRSEFAIADVPLSMAADGGDLAEILYFMKSLMSSITIGGSIGELIKFQIDSTSSGVNEQLVRGTIMEDGKTARTSASNTVTQTLGAVGATQKMYAIVHLLAFTGTSVTFAIESAATDFSTTTTRATFTAQTAAGSQIIVPIAGSITDTFWRVYYTGTFTTFNAVIAIGIQ